MKSTPCVVEKKSAAASELGRGSLFPVSEGREKQTRDLRDREREGVREQKSIKSGFKFPLSLCKEVSGERDNRNGDSLYLYVVLLMLSFWPLPEMMKKCHQDEGKIPFPPRIMDGGIVPQKKMVQIQGERGEKGSLRTAYSLL